MRKTIKLVLIICLSILLSGLTSIFIRKEVQDMNLIQRDVIQSLLLNETATDIDKNANTGLLNPSSVGVIADRFENEELVNIKESDFNVIIDATNFGVIANDRKDDTLTMIEALAKAKEEGLKGNKVLVKLPSGRLDFVEGVNTIEREYAVSLIGAKNITILGNDTLIEISGVISGFHIINCENITIKGIKYDYARAPFSVGEIISSSPRQVVVRIKDNYSMEGITNINDYLEFDKYSHLPRSNGNFLLSSDIKNYIISGQTITINFYGNINQPVNGTLVVVSHYTYSHNGFYIEDSKNLTFENVDLYTTAGMGFVCLASEDIVVNRFNVRLKPNSDRLMTATADGMHFGACRGTISVTNCLLENSHDDAINVKAGHYFNIKSINKVSKTIELVKLNYMHRIAVDDEIYFYTANLGYVCKVKVTEVLSFDGTIGYVKVDNIPDELTTNLIAANHTTAPALTFENNIIRNKRNRGILLQTINSTVKNNSFFNVGHGAISIMTEASQFNEAIIPENIVIDSNKMVGCNSMSDTVGSEIGIMAYGREWVNAPAGTIKNVEIVNNFIGNTARIAVSISSGDEIYVHNNLIYNPALKAKSIQNNCAMAIAESTNLVFESNYVLKETPDEDFVSLFSDGTVAENQITLSNNKNLAFKEVTETVEPDVITKLQNGKTINMTTTNLDDFDGVEDSINIIGFTDAYGNEVRLDDDNFKIKMLKVTYDDNGIYIGFEIKDNEIDFYPASNFWSGDLFELFITPETKSSYGFPIVRLEYADTAQIAFTPSYLYVEPSRTSQKLQEQGSKAFKGIAWQTEDGWAGKFMISFEVCTELKELASNNGIMSMAIVLADTDEGTDRIQASNTAHNVETNKYIPVKMGKIKFN